PVLIAYEELLKKYATDYSKVRHDKIDGLHLKNFFQQDYETAAFENSQSLDLEGLQGRMASSSYMPNVSDPVFPEIAGELKTLFANHAESGRITVLYRTRVFYSQF